MKLSMKWLPLLSFFFLAFSPALFADYTEAKKPVSQLEFKLYKAEVEINRDIENARKVKSKNPMAAAYQNVAFLSLEKGGNFQIIANVFFYPEFDNRSMDEKESTYSQIFDGLVHYLHGFVSKEIEQSHIEMKIFFCAGKVCNEMGTWKQGKFTPLSL